MKVLLLSSHLNMGGITRYLLTLAKGLIASGHEVHIISSGGEVEERFQRIGARTKTINFFCKSILNPKIYFALGPIDTYIREHQIDVVHAQTRITQVMGHILSHRSNIPYVSTCHGYFKMKLSRRLWPCWGEVIAISEAVEEHLKNDLRVKEDSIHLIRHGIELDQFPEVSLEQKAALRQKYNVKDGPLIGMVARLSDVKGQDILIKAMPRIVKAVPDVKLILFGEGKMKDELMRLVDTMRLSDHVQFNPTIDKTYECLSFINVCVVPSRQEGLGLSVMEAQACGVAVVAARVGGIVSLIQDGITGSLVSPQDSEALAEAVISLLNDEVKCHSIALAARSHALAHYGAPKMIKATINVYEHAIEQKRQQNPGR